MGIAAAAYGDIGRSGRVHWPTAWAAAVVGTTAVAALRRAANKPALQALARSTMLASALAGAVSSYCAAWCPALALLPMDLTGKKLLQHDAPARCCCPRAAVCAWQFEG